MSSRLLCTILFLFGFLFIARGQDVDLRDTLLTEEELEPVSTEPRTEIFNFQSTFVTAFFQSISMILVSELGDKTFFIAAIMAMTHPKRTIFLGAISALAVMTVLSAAVGATLPGLLPRQYTQAAATILFLFFGINLLRSAWSMPNEQSNEELKEVESELAEKGLSDTAHALEEGTVKEKPKANNCITNLVLKAVSPIWLQSFTLTFLAEWGDRSQIATIALATTQDVLGVTLGGIIGHAACTGLAVTGGKLLATRISERAVAFTGGALFLVFAVHNALVGENQLY